MCTFFLVSYGYRLGVRIDKADDKVDILVIYIFFVYGGLNLGYCVN